MNFAPILAAIVTYLTKNPQVVEALIAAGFQEIISLVQAHPASVTTSVAKA